MKNLAFIFSILLVGISANAKTNSDSEDIGRGYDGNSYIFVEGDIEFSVFPDGQFDFVYVGPQKGSQVTISTPNVNVSFNSGYNYDTYVQYDDYGAVIQVEDVPIYYDEYGRIAQAGNVDIQYNDRRIVRVGGLHVVYNNYGYFSHCTGVINVFNPYYVYRPWHTYYAPPVYTHCVVYDMPYRRYYQPVRYSYHDHIKYYKRRGHVAYQNGRRDFYRPGSRVYDKKGRASVNKNYNPTRKNTMVAQNTRSNNSYSRSSNTASKGASNARSSNSGNSRSNSSVRKSQDATTRNNSTKKEIGRNSSTSRSKEQAVSRNNTQRVSNNSSNTRSAGVKSNRTNNTAVKTQRQERTKTATRSSGNSVKQNRTQAPKKETASRDTSTRKSSANNSRSSSGSSRESSSRGRG